MSLKFGKLQIYIYYLGHLYFWSHSRLMKMLLLKKDSNLFKVYPLVQFQNAYIF